MFFTEMESTAIRERYESLRSATDRQLRRLSKRIFMVSMLRVTLFVAIVAGVYVLRREAWPVWSLFFLTTALFFVCLVKRHAVLFRRRQWLDAQRRVYTDELSALERDYSVFDGGTDFVNASHDYTYDLDVFGERSLFQCINRTCTEMGRTCLAGWFGAHETDVTVLKERQNRVRFLASRPGFREGFRTAGLCRSEGEMPVLDVGQWVSMPFRLVSSPFLRVALWVVPFVNAVLIIGALAGFWPGSFAGLFFVLFLMASLLMQRRVTQIQQAYDRLYRLLHTYSGLLRTVDEELAGAACMKPLYERLTVDGCSAVEAVRRLERMLDVLDRRNNILVSSVLDGLYWWQLRQLVRLERWRTEYGAHLPVWMGVLGEIDALCSLATFAYNHPSAVFAEWSEGPFVLQARGMKHPLMDPTRCVPNDASLPGCPFFVVVTGANMAGKSTYLRTLGVNYLLACVGAPSTCESLRLSPASLVTSLRTTDSLADGESYFFAELKRLQSILERLGKGERLFVVLDEILKGTNSLDKQRGSLALVRKLMELNANGIIATHDLQLASLARVFPGKIDNVCFEADIEGDELTFSYRMRPGVAHNMNACFLMRRMGLEIES